MKCAILQPSYIPWRGYFHQIQKSDVFVFYDDVQYDKHGWRNRNRIKTAQGPQWLTIPVQKKGNIENAKLICDMDIAWDRQWNRKHLTALTQSYAKAKYFSRMEPNLTKWYAARPVKLADFTIDLTVELAGQLGIKHTKFVRSSTLGIPGVRTERLIKIIKTLGCDHYISGPSAKAYLKEDCFAQAGIVLEYMQYAYPEYPQLYPPFDPYVSIFDLFLMTGEDAPNYIWGT
jgi:hypothetical protein